MSTLSLLPRALAQMSSLAHISDKDNCEDLSGLVKRQRRICRRNIELMDSVRVGALMAIDECQAQFKYRRWNCSTENNLKLFGNVILKQGQFFDGGFFSLGVVCTAKTYI